MNLYIEIFVRELTVAKLIVWVESIVGPLGTADTAGDAVVYLSGLGRIIFTQGIDGGQFVSVAFNTRLSLWDSHAECARQAAKELGCAVRCDPDSFMEVAQVSDVVLEVSPDGSETLLEWSPD